MPCVDELVSSVSGRWGQDGHGGEMPRTDSTRFSPNTPWEDMGCPGQIAPFFNNTLWEETPPAAADGLIQRLPTMPKMQKIKMSGDFFVLNRNSTCQDQSVKL